MYVKQTQRNSLICIIIISFIGTIVSLYEVTRNPIDSTYDLSQNPNNIPLHFQYVPPHAPPHLSKLDPSQTFYIAIIDSEYEPSDVQCAQKDAWINTIEKLPFVDGIEYFSINSYTNTKCNVTTVSFPRPPDNFPLDHDPSCVIFKNAIDLFLERSNAGYLFLISDNAFIWPEKFEMVAHTIASQVSSSRPRIFGHCTQLRDYFETFALNSGCLMTRTLAMQISQNNHTFDIACQMEISGMESLIHTMEMSEVFAISSHHTMFLGFPFDKQSDYQALLKNDFRNIQKCPSEYHPPRVCSPTTQPLQNVVVWSAFGLNMNKTAFLMNAKTMLQNAGPQIGYMYGQLSTDLCIL